jgi:hypothetical protein
MRIAFGERSITLSRFSDPRALQTALARCQRGHVILGAWMGFITDRYPLSVALERHSLDELGIAVLVEATESSRRSISGKPESSFGSATVPRSPPCTWSQI